MIKIILIFIIFFAAVAISPVLIGEKGYILIAMGDITIESSVVTATLFLIVLFVALLMSLKVFKGGINFSLGAWNRIAFAGKRRGERDYRKGIAAYLLGDFQQAEHLLAKSAEPSNQQDTAYLIAAKAAQSQSLEANASHYIQLLEHHQQSNDKASLESVLIQADLLLAQQNFTNARELMDKYHSYLGQDHRLLALEIKLCLQEKNTDAAIEWVNKAAKTKTFSAPLLRELTFAAYLQKFTEVIGKQSNTALHEYWDKLSRKAKQDTQIIAAYCQVLASNGMTEPLTKLLVPVIKKGVNTPLINQVKTLTIHKPAELISAVQKHLQRDQHNSFWLSCLGHFANAGQDWPLAERAFNSLAGIPDTTLSDTDKRGYAKALANQEKFREATQVLLTE
ncbi:heme biosynthesis HemY N-terminal domain-containing protein [Thalassotalea euphylliae]|uniref:heme biosynthesis HemY N-terminal domain-containing protein n=1 Tax=Thalassotalea euphylliae TaxID=1655234 RepID=UPI0036322DC4